MNLDWWFIGYVGVMACWFVFAGVFMLRKRGPREERTERKRDWLSIVAIALQAVGYAIVWLLFRKPHTSLAGDQWAPLLTMASILLAVVSVWLVVLSVRTLGKQWALAARVVEGHKLITEGPYASVRNPIYTGMFGMLIATGVAISRWYGLLIGCAVFLAATMWRISIEEKLLRSEFHQEFDAYCKRVPALVPRITR